MSKNLLKDIGTIKTEGKAQISDKIMERLRGETIFLPKSYVDAKKEEAHCTIDPMKCLDITLSQIEDGIVEDNARIDLIKQGIVAIKGNSFGPYLPKHYFQDDILKLVWILKEPYIFINSYENGDRGAHDQAAEYIKHYIDYKCLGNTTHDVIIEISQLLLQTLATIPIKIINLISNPVIKDQILHLQCEDLNNKITIMSHICILEVNHFPGLAFNQKATSKTQSQDSDILQWENINAENIRFLIDFFYSFIILGSSELLSMLSDGDSMAKEHLFNFLKTKSYEDLKKPNGYPDTKMLSSEILGSENVQIHYVTQDNKKKEKIFSMVLDADGRMWFSCPHPSAGCWKNTEFKNKSTKWIKDRVLPVSGSVRTDV
ncbi:MAG: hypothetical protein K2G77_02440 [Muribaculaceae bacterium]|nr:hypothetical protein [Muribaculaceae bacterium]